MHQNEDDINQEVVGACVKRYGDRLITHRVDQGMHVSFLSMFDIAPGTVPAAMPWDSSGSISSVAYYQKISQCMTVGNWLSKLKGHYLHRDVTTAFGDEPTRHDTRVALIYTMNDTFNGLKSPLGNA